MMMPCAMLSMLKAPQTRASPSAASAYMAPKVRPLTMIWMKKFTVRARYRQPPR